jgi:hypothetical protein
MGARLLPIFSSAVLLGIPSIQIYSHNRAVRCCNRDKPRRIQVQEWHQSKEPLLGWAWTSNSLPPPSALPHDNLPLPSRKVFAPLT